MAPTKKPKTGRPSDYDPSYCEKLVEHMSTGLSFESFAGVINSCRATLYEWEKKHPAFSDAKKRGSDASLLYWEKLARNGAEGKLKAPSAEIRTIEPGGVEKVVTKYRAATFSAAACIFSMKNRFPDLYRDRQDVHLHDAGKDDLSDRTPEEILNRAESLLAKMRDSRGKK